MPPQFDHEKLHVYQTALQFVAWSTPLLRELKEKSASESANTRDHLDRASLSTVYNIAEGNGKHALGSRQNFWDVARGSAVECAACLDTLVAKALVTAVRICEGKELFLRVVQMLTKMVLTCEANRIREDEPVYRIKSEIDSVPDERESSSTSTSTSTSTNTNGPAISTPRP